MAATYLDSLRDLHASTLRLLGCATEGDMTKLEAEARVQQQLFGIHAQTPRGLLRAEELAEARRLHEELIAAHDKLRGILAPLHSDIGQLLEQMSA